MRWGLIALGGLVIVTAGVFAGIAVAGGFGNEPNSDALASATGAPVYDCPAGSAVTGYSPGSRVFVVAETESGDWVQIRDLDQPGRRLWMRSADIDRDSIVLDLPVSDCGSIEVALDAIEATPTGSTSTTLATITTTTVAASTTTTEAPTTTAPPPSPPTTQPPPTTTTPASDTTSPQISGPSAAPTNIWEANGGGLTCPASNARSSTISAVVTDNVAVAAVTASWTVGGAPTLRPMTRSGDSYSTTFGPFSYQTVTEFDPKRENVTITIRAVDGSGNESSTTTNVTIHSLQACQ